ncbi:MAG: carboxypeptidase regulatory-like domain-containing protein [Methylococcales bacterium]|nr:carboxypeptidase regulatory-like domain-containing protein [Methylococcales bacterium]
MPITHRINITFLFILFVTTTLSAESLKGKVVDKKGKPITGMIIKLFHPKHGMSRPRYTNKRGQFHFRAIPSSKGQYDIEYYWKDRLVHRERITVKGDTRLPITTFKSGATNK